MTISQLINTIIEKLLPKYKSKEQSQIHAWWFVEWATNKQKAALLSSNQEISPAIQEKIFSALDSHINQNKPIQYIFGSIPFLDLTINIKPPILIPRPETEYWCSVIIEKLKKLTQPLKILDLCTGSGCIALSFAKSFPKSTVCAIDINPESCLLTQQNAAANNIRNINIIQSNLFQDIPKTLKFDLILSNPPYISESEWKKLDPLVKDWEDPSALKTTDNGLEIIKNIIQESKNWLSPNKENLPNLVIEIGHEQGAIVKQILKQNDYKNIKINQDQFGKDRFVTAYGNF